MLQPLKLFASIIVVRLHPPATRTMTMITKRMKKILRPEEADERWKETGIQVGGSDLAGEVATAQRLLEVLY